jgi:hypothetical protein
MRESQHLHRNRTHFHTLLPIDLVCLVLISLRMQAQVRGHPTHHEMHHDNTPPTTHKQTTMPPYELLLQRCCRLVQQQREAYRNETNLRIQ